MTEITRGKWHRGLAVYVLALFGAGGLAVAQQPPGAQAREAEPAFTVDGKVALASLISLADGHLTRMADMLGLVAAGQSRSARWSSFREPLAEVARRSVPAVLWYALPDGSYWTVAQGRVSGNLATRSYFPRLMAGKTVIGELVVSMSSGRSVAIVAVPVRGADGKVTGALGSSIHLDSLSLLIEREMGLPRGYTFYSMDSTPLGALNRNPSLIFTRPLSLGEDLSRAIREMLARNEGVVTYQFLESRRTVLYRRSRVTGWWYALGVVAPEASPGAH